MEMIRVEPVLLLDQSMVCISPNSPADVNSRLPYKRLIKVAFFDLAFISAQRLRMPTGRMVLMGFFAMVGAFMLVLDSNSCVRGDGPPLVLVADAGASF